MLGQGNFIPGFEEGIAGAKAGEERDVIATFPDDYPVATLAGKDANFDVKVKEVATAVRPEVDDEFAKTLGAENVAQLQGAGQRADRPRVRQRRAHEAEARAARPAREGARVRAAAIARRQRVRRIWEQLETNLKRSGKTFADEGKTEDEAREEYRRIAERRVRLGLVIGEIAETQRAQVTQDEMRKALIEQARRFPARRRPSTNTTRRPRARWPSCGRRSSRTRSSISSSTRPSPRTRRFPRTSCSRRWKTPPRRNRVLPTLYSRAVVAPPWRGSCTGGRHCPRKTTAAARFDDLYREPQTFLAFGALGTQRQIPFQAWRISLAEGVAKAGGLVDSSADPGSVFIYRGETRETVEAMGVDTSQFKGPLVPVIYSLNLKDPGGYFLRTDLGDAKQRRHLCLELRVGGARQVQIIARHAIRHGNRTRMNAAITYYTLKNVQAGTGAVRSSAPAVVTSPPL